MELQKERVKIMYCLNIPKEESSPYEKAMDAERLLRSLGATGRYTGFDYLIFIVDTLLTTQDSHYFVTKCIYPDTAKRFGVNTGSVEHAIRTVVQTCWKRADHSALDYVAGVHLEKIPTNSQFIDLLVAFLRYKKKTERGDWNDKP